MDAIRQSLAGWPDGLAAPWPVLQQSGGYFDPGSLALLAAATSAGKTTVIANLAMHWLGMDDSTEYIWWSCEMPAPLLVVKCLALLVRMLGGTTDPGMMDVLEQHRITGWLTPDVHAASQWLESRADRLHLLDDPTITASNLAEYCVQAKKHAESQGRRIGAILIDYAQELTPSDPGDIALRMEHLSREIEVSTTAVRLRRLAQDLNAPVIAAAQLNREDAHDPDRLPELERIRESARPGQNASLALGLRNARMAGDGTLPGESDAEIAAGIAALVSQATATGWMPVPPRPYTATPRKVTEAWRSGARLAIAEQFGSHAELLEIFTLKDRLRGCTALVAPLAALWPSGLIVQPQRSYTPPATLRRGEQGLLAKYFGAAAPTNGTKNGTAKNALGEGVVP